MSQLFSRITLVDSVDSSFIPYKTDGPAITIKGLAGQTEDLLIVENSSGTQQWAISAAGVATATGTIQAQTTQHLVLNTQSDNRQVRINSRNFTQASGSSIGMQSKPSQTVTTTGDVIGAEFSPRTSDVGAGALIAVRADPVIKDATSARTVSAVRGLEINIDYPNAGSVITTTNDVSAIRIFPDFGSGHTFSGVKAVLEMAAPNTSNFDYLIESETGNATWIVVGAGTYSTADGYMLIRHEGNVYRVPFFTAVD